MRKLTIKSRLWAGFGTLALLLLAMSVVALMRLSAVNTHMSDIMRHNDLHATLTNNIVEQVDHTSRAIRNILFIDDVRQNTADADRIRQADAVTQSNLDQLATLPFDTASQSLLAAVLLARQDYLAQRTRVMNLLDVQFKDGVIDLLNDEVQPEENRYIAAIGQLAQYHTETIRLATENTAATGNMNHMMMLALTALGLILAAIILHTIVGTVTSSLFQAARIAQHSVTAAKGIKALMEDTVGSINNGNRLVGHAGVPAQEHMARFIETIPLFHIVQNNQTYSGARRAGHHHATDDTPQE